MDTEIMLRLLEDADLEGDVLCFCRDFPEYQQSKTDLEVWYEKAEKLLGYREFCKFEAAISRYYSWEARAYYAFGLRLREELKRAMMWE